MDLYITIAFFAGLYAVLTFIDIPDVDEHETHAGETDNNPGRHD